jgi:two-component system nitrate/nitrite response regulator NarL
MQHPTIDQVDHVQLSVREAQILDGIILGLTNKEIASKLGISPHTVGTRIYGLMLGLKCINRTQMAVWGVQNPGFRTGPVAMLPVEPAQAA